MRINLTFVKIMAIFWYSNTSIRIQLFASQLISVPSATDRRRFSNTTGPLLALFYRSLLSMR
jgi:hypothetical protein